MSTQNNTHRGTQTPMLPQCQTPTHVKQLLHTHTHMAVNNVWHDVDTACNARSPVSCLLFEACSRVMSKNNPQGKHNIMHSVHAACNLDHNMPCLHMHFHSSLQQAGQSTQLKTIWPPPPAPSWATGRGSRVGPRTTLVELGEELGGALAARVILVARLHA